MFKFLHLHTFRAFTRRKWRASECGIVFHSQLPVGGLYGVSMSGLGMGYCGVFKHISNERIIYG